MSKIPDISAIVLRFAQAQAGCDAMQAQAIFDPKNADVRRALEKLAAESIKIAEEVRLAAQVELIAEALFRLPAATHLPLFTDSEGESARKAAYMLCRQNILTLELDIVASDGDLSRASAETNQKMDKIATYAAKKYRPRRAKRSGDLDGLAWN